MIDEKIKKSLYDISKLIFDIYNKIKINKYKCLDNEKNINDLKNALEYEKYLYSKLKLTKEEADELLIYFNRINSFIFPQDSIIMIIKKSKTDEKKYFELNELEEKILIHQRIFNNIELYVIKNVELNVDYNAQLELDNYQDYTGIYIDFFKEFDYYSKKNIDSIFGEYDYDEDDYSEDEEDYKEYEDEDDEEYYVEEFDDGDQCIADFVQTKYYKEESIKIEKNTEELKREAKKYSKYALNKDHVILYDENLKVHLKYLGQTDFIINYIKQINIHLQSNDYDVINQTYDFSFIDPLFEEALLKCNYDVESLKLYSADLELKNKKYIKYYQSILLVQYIIITINTMNINYESKNNLDIFECTLIDMIVNKIDLEILNYLLKKCNHKFKGQYIALETIEDLIKVINKKSKALIKKNNMLK